MPQFKKPHTHVVIKFVNNCSILGTLDYSPFEQVPLMPDIRDIIEINKKIYKVTNITVTKYELQNITKYIYEVMEES